jgi:hypothetical protein
MSGILNLSIFRLELLTSQFPALSYNIKAVLLL